MLIVQTSEYIDSHHQYELCLISRALHVDVHVFFCTMLYIAIKPFSINKHDNYGVFILKQLSVCDVSQLF